MQETGKIVLAVGRDEISSVSAKLEKVQSQQECDCRGCKLLLYSVGLSSLEHISYLCTCMSLFTLDIIYEKLPGDKKRSANVYFEYCCVIAG